MVFDKKFDVECYTDWMWFNLNKVKMVSFQVKSYVSDWSRKDNLRESNNSILTSDMLSTYYQNVSIKLYIFFYIFNLPISEFVWSSFIIFADSCHPWVNTLKRTETEIWNGQMIYVLLFIYTVLNKERKGKINPIIHFFTLSINEQ